MFSNLSSNVSDDKVNCHKSAHDRSLSTEDIFILGDIKVKNLLLLLVFSMISHNVFGIILTTEDMGGGRLQIGYQVEAGEAPVGFALRIELDQGSYISAPSDVTSSSYFPIFMDYAYEVTDYQIGDGHPIAAYNQAGSPVFPVSDFVVCVASPLSLQSGQFGLEGDFNYDAVVDQDDLNIMASSWLSSTGSANGNPDTDLTQDAIVNLLDYALIAESTWAGSLENLLTIQLYDGGTGSTNVTISADPLRGGVLGENGGVIPVSLTQVTMTVPEPTTMTFLALGGLLLRRRTQIKFKIESFTDRRS